MEPLIKIRKKNDPADPVSRMVHKDVEDQGMSPMAPPDLYAPPGNDLSIPYEDMHPVLQAFRDEHKEIIASLDAFEAALNTIIEAGPNREVEETLRKFFQCIDDEVMPHNQEEERALFPMLAQKLLDAGEHSGGAKPTTAIDVLKADHLQIIQMSAVIFNFFAVGSRLPDPASAGIVFKAAVEQGQHLVELMRLHIFREDNVLFSLAHKHLSSVEFDAMLEQPIEQ